MNISKLRLRQYLKKVFDNKLIETRQNRFTRTRQVRKFSSNFLYKRLDKKFSDFFFKKTKVPLKRTKIQKVSFLQKRSIDDDLLNNLTNFKAAAKNTRAFIKFKKVNRRRRTSRKYFNFKFYQKFKKELFRINPLSRFFKSNLNLLSFNYNYLMNFHTAIGNNIKSWVNPSIFSKILAIRNDMILYDLSFTFIALKKGLQGIFQISKFKGSILGYVNLDRNYKFSGVGFDHFLRTWLPGYLTNFKKVLKNILSLQTKNIFNLNRRQRKFLKNIDLKKKLHYNKDYYFWTRKPLDKLGNSTKIPAVPSFGFSLEDSFIWVNECQKVGLRTMCVCDSESFPQKIDFPLIGNQKSLPLSFFLVKMVSESISSAKRFDYFSFVGFNYISDVFVRTQKEKVIDRLKKFRLTLN